MLKRYMFSKGTKATNARKLSTLRRLQQKRANSHNQTLKSEGLYRLVAGGFERGTVNPRTPHQSEQRRGGAIYAGARV